MKVLVEPEFLLWYKVKLTGEIQVHFYLLITIKVPNHDTTSGLREEEKYLAITTSQKPKIKTKQTTIEICTNTKSYAWKSM